MEPPPRTGPGASLQLRQLLLHVDQWTPSARIHHHGHAWTYPEFHGRIRRLAGALRNAGVTPGTVVGVLDWDSHRYLELFFAVPLVGAVLHTINFRLSPEQLLYTINHAEDAFLFVHPDFQPLIDRLAPAFARPGRVIPMGPVEAAATEGDYEALIASAPPLPGWPEIDEDTRATTFYTTGTTGEPKGVSFTHRQLVLHTLTAGFSLAAFGDPFSFRQGDVYMPLTPMFHVHAWGFPYLATLLGADQVYPGRYEPSRLIRLILDHGVTVTHGVPTVLHLLLDEAERLGARFDGLKMLVGGSALTPGLCERAADRGIRVTTGYGMSETGPIVATGRVRPDEADATDSRRREIFTSTGFPLPFVEAALLDADGVPLPAGSRAPGELALRSPWLTAGYVKDAPRSAELWRDGWLHTGDVARRDADGYLRITDRLKDVIKSGGEWVSSLELESLISLHPDVREAAVVGVPDERWGERPVAYVVGRTATAAAELPIRLRAHLQRFVESGRLQRWAVPTDFRCVAELPRTSVGKLDKRALRRTASSPPTSALPLSAP